MTHDELIAAYGEKYGLDGFALVDGLALLNMGEGLGVYVESRDGALLLQTKVGSEQTPDPRLLRHMLGANLFFAGKNHACLAMDAENGDILLLLGVDSGALDLDAFESALGELVAEADYWRDFLHRGKAALDALAPASRAAPEPGAGGAPLPGMLA